MKESELKELTKAEEEVMQVLWKLGKAFVKDVLHEFKDPKPAYNTVSTIVRILVEKGFVSYVAFGKTHQYFPVVTKENYSKFILNTFKKGYFSNSFQNMLSFMVEENDLSLRDLEEIQNLIEIKNKKS